MTNAGGGGEAKGLLDDRGGVGKPLVIEGRDRPPVQHLVRLGLQPLPRPGTVGQVPQGPAQGRRGRTDGTAQHHVHLIANLRRGVGPLIAVPAPAAHNAQATRSRPSNDGARDRSMAASTMPSNLRNTDSTSRRARRGSLRSRRENGRKLTMTSYFNARRASVAMPGSGFRSRPTIMLIVMAPMSSINASVISISSPARHPFWRARTCSTSMSSWTSCSRRRTALPGWPAASGTLRRGALARPGSAAAAS